MSLCFSIQVSMFDLTVQLEKESDAIYRDVCLKIKEAARFVSYSWKLPYSPLCFISLMKIAWL